MLRTVRVAGRALSSLPSPLSHSHSLSVKSFYLLQSTASVLDNLSSDLYGVQEVSVPVRRESLIIYAEMSKMSGKHFLSYYTVYSEPANAIC